MEFDQMMADSDAVMRAASMAPSSMDFDRLAADMHSQSVMPNARSSMLEIPGERSQSMNFNAPKGGKKRRGTVSVTQNKGKRLLGSELSLEDKQFVIDVARPNPDMIPPNDLNYRMPDSELILEHLLIIAHEGESADLREIMMTIDSDKFNQ